MSIEAEDLVECNLVRVKIFFGGNLTDGLVYGYKIVKKEKENKREFFFFLFTFL